MSPILYYHLKESDYGINFPEALDDKPILVQKQTYVDAWIYIRFYSMIKTIQQFLITNKTTIEL